MLDQQVFDLKQKQAELAQRLVGNGIAKDEYLTQRKILQEKTKDLAGKLNALSQSS